MKKPKQKVYGKNDRLANVVALGHAKPNKLFPDWLTELVRFLRYSEPVPCAHCGRKSKSHWTCLASFRVHEFGLLSTVPSGQVLPPLTPVCGKHVFAPEIIHSPKK